MKIDRDRAKKAFINYVSNYDINSEKIKLKIGHTYRVADICEKIAVSLNMSSEDIDIAYLTGLLHDIGRFEQVRRYGTFNDLKSVDHAKLGAVILFDEGKIRDFIDNTDEDDMIRKVIENHNEYRIEDGLSDRCITFCNILRDADKVDIFRVNSFFSPEEIYDVTKEEIINSEITEEVLESFKKKDTVLRSLKKTAVDNILGHISLVFGLVYKESIKIVNEQNYLENLLAFKSNNENTNKQFEEVRKMVLEHLDIE